MHAITTRRLAPYGFLLPYLVLFGVFGVFAIGLSFGISFTDWEGLRGGSFVGLDNYARLLDDQSFRDAFVHTAIVAVVVVPTLSFGGLALAWALQSNLVRLQRSLRTAMFLPVLPPLVVVGTAFVLLLDPVYGLPNIVLKAVGLGPIDIYTDSAADLPVIVLVVVWRYLGYNMVIHLAGLQSLSHDVLEAARLDGASPGQIFWRIIVPLSKRALIFTSVLSTFGVFSLFDEVYVLFGTEGGPSEGGLLMGPLIYREGFIDFNMGYAAAMAYVVVAIVLVLALVQMKVSRDDD
jgi:lactose/L-arabinose transport system permease protein